MDVDIITEPVTVTAQVQAPSGQTAPKTMVVTLQRASGKKGDQAIEGRWIIMRQRRDAEPQLDHLELREFRAQRLLPHRVESHDQLDVVVELLDATAPCRGRTADGGRARLAAALTGTDWSSSAYE